MPQADRNSQKENKSRGNEPNFNWRGVILIVIAFSFIALAMLFYRGGMQPVEDVPYNRFLEQLEKTIVRDVFDRLHPSPVKEHGECNKAKGNHDENDAAPVKIRLVPAGFILLLRVAISLRHGIKRAQRECRLP